MISKCKKLVTDITRKSDLENNIQEFGTILGAQYNYYATVKMCMNYYTVKEMISDTAGLSEDLTKDFNVVSDLIHKHIIKREAVESEDITSIETIRNSIEHKMKNLTAFIDGFEIYEYILNRIEARVKNLAEEVDIEQLSAKMFQYVFSEKDTVVINSKLQLLMGQLPVRMTKNKFYDIVSNTLSIYKGGETSSVNDFADMLRNSALITKPEGFDTDYPELFKVYEALEKADYKNITEDKFDELRSNLTKAAGFITEEVSAYMLMQEVVNDVYTILLTVDKSYETNISKEGYKAAVDILDACAGCENVEDISVDTMDLFMAIEGVQENVYESIIVLDSAFDDITKGNGDIIEKLQLQDVFKSLKKANKLMSTSLFVDLNKDDEEGLIADNDYIMKLRDQLTNEFAKAFEDKDRAVVRSIMCKIIAAMPIFLNSQQEIKDYFDYVLESCKDDSELTACNKLICELIEED